MSESVDNPPKNRSKAGKILELKSVSAGYANKLVLKDINLDIYPRDFLGLIGPNGSGKTTLLKVILGLVPLKKGRLIYHFSHKGVPGGNIGYLPQLSHYDRRFPITIQDVVQSGLISGSGLFHWLSAKEKQHTNEILEIMGINQLRNQAIGELSGGQLQRVFLARALISSPEMLILDEPNTFVDKSFEKSLFEILKELNTKISIVLVSHDLGMIASYVKTIACLSDTLYYHDSNEITQELLDKYNCPIDLITHGDIPHRVLKPHKDPDV